MSDQQPPKQINPETARTSITSQLYWDHDILECRQRWNELEILEDEPYILIPDLGSFIFSRLTQSDSIQKDRAGRRSIESRTKAQ